MPGLGDNQVQFWIFAAMFGLVTVMGFAAARWRRPDNIHTLEEWGLGGRAFGNWVTFFLLSGDVYTAYTFVAVPPPVDGGGAAGLFPGPFPIIVFPTVFVVLARVWSGCLLHRLVLPAGVGPPRIGPPGLGPG